jgi:lincosamide nucleotidyltransferase A/C/D/E
MVDQREAAQPNAGMEATEVLDLYKLLTKEGIAVWVDGGWGVDALLGEQTRPHADLDIAVRHEDVERLRELLADRSYIQVERSDTSPWNFVLRDNRGHDVDVHTFTLDDEGHNVYGIAYPAESLSGSGTINGRSVNCIALQSVVQFHENYEPDEDDIKDMVALHDRFGIDLPARYHRHQLQEIQWR